MHSDLVGSTGLELTGEQRSLHRFEQLLFHVVVGARRPTVGRHDHPERITARPSDGRVDDAVRVLGVPPHERRVGPLDLVRGQLVHQVGVGRRVARHHQQPRGSTVQTVNQSRPQRITHSGQLRELGEQAVDQCAVTVPVARMDHQSRRLVDHDHVVVYMDERDLDGGIGRRVLLDVVWIRGERDGVARAHPVRSLQHHAS